MDATLERNALVKVLANYVSLEDECHPAHALNRVEAALALADAAARHHINLNGYLSEGQWATLADRAYMASAPSERTRDLAVRFYNEAL